jgi:hypothetical protein
MKLFYKILFIFLGKGLFSLLHNPGRITSILTHINTFISELVFSLGERHEAFRMISLQKNDYLKCKGFFLHEELNVRLY